MSNLIGCSPVQLISAAPTLPAGVTLQAIDGETMLTSTAMSNNYFSRNGFTQAINTANGRLSWDDPAFFPTGTFYIDATTTGMTKAVDLGYNFAVAVDAGPTFSTFDTFSMWYICDPDGGDPIPSAPTFDYVATLYHDEPANATGLYPTSGGNNSWTGTQMTHVPFWMNLTYSSIINRPPFAFGFDGTGPDIKTMITPNTFWTTPSPGSQSRGVDIIGLDLYWFVARNMTTGSGWQFNCADTVNQGFGFTITSDQCARGSNYGNMIDLFRRDWMPSGALTKAAAIPMVAIVENNIALAPSGPTAGTAITAPEMAWAVWSTIIHGVRGYMYFYWGDIVGLSAGNAIYDTTKATNAVVKSIAPIINSPNAINYVSVSPSSYVFPSLNQAAWVAWTNTGIQCCAKFYTGPTAGILVQNHFYIIASTAFGESGYTTQTATFTIVNQGRTTATVLYSSDNASPSPISISGGTTFTDTFPNPWSVRVYRIDP